MGGFAQTRGVVCHQIGTVLARFNRQRQRHRERVGAIAVIQARAGGGLGHSRSCGGGETWLGSGYFSR